jgi:hypothetical protein
LAKIEGIAGASIGFNSLKNRESIHNTYFIDSDSGSPSFLCSKQNFNKNGIDC